MRGKKVALLSLFGLTSWLVSPLMALASAPPTAGLNFQGRLTQTDGTPLEGSNVTFNLRILSPTGCILYDERQTINMSGSNGVFDLTIGQGDNTFSGQLNPSPALTLPQVFSNSGTLNGLSGCGGGTYTPVAGDTRQLQVQFYDGSTWVSMTPNHVIRSVPYSQYALSADQLDGLGKDSFIKVNSGTAALTQSNVEQVFQSSSNVTEILALIGGTSTQYVRPGSNASFTSAVSFAQAPTYSGSISSGTQLVNKNYCDANIGGLAADATITSLGAGDSGKTLQWNGTKWVASSVSGSITALTGDVTASGSGSVAATIANDAITAAKIQDGAVTNAKVASGLDASKLTTGTIPYARLPVGSATNTVAAGDDPRLSDARTPLTHGHNASDITAGTLSVARGGTGASSFNANRLLVTNGTGTAIQEAACTNGQTIQFNVLGEVVCVNSGSGSVSSITAGTGLTGGTITSSGTIAVDVGTTANKIVQLDGSAKLPAVDASQVTGLTAAQIPSLDAAKIGSGTFSAGRLPALSGDVSSSAGSASLTVTKLQGNAVQNTAPSDGQVLKWNASLNAGAGGWEPGPDNNSASAGTVTSVTASSPLSVTNGSTTPALSISDATTAAKGVVQVGTGLAVSSGVVSLATAGTAGTYSKVTTDSYGRVTSGASLSASDITTSLGYTPIDRAGSNAMAANLNLSPDGGTTKYKIINLADPTSASDAATKNYCDAQIGGQSLALGTSSSGHVLYYNGVGWTNAALSSVGITNVTQGTGISVGIASGNATVSLATAGTAGTYAKVTTDAYGRVTSGTTLAASDIPNIDASKITSGTLSAARMPATFTNFTSTGIDDNASATALTIASDGKVGIGTAYPSAQLEVASSAANPNIRFTNSGAGAYTYPGISIWTHTGSYGGGGIFGFYTSRGSSATPSATQAGDELGALQAHGWGTAWNGAGAAVNFTADDAFTGTSKPTRIGFYTTNYNETGGSERVRIDPAGNVGIGTTTPKGKAHIFGAGQTATAASFPTGNQGATLVLEDSGNGIGNGGMLVLGSRNGTGSSTVGFAAIKAGVTDASSNGVGNLYFLTRNLPNDSTLTERVTIQSGGNVGIGTTSPSEKLQVNGGIKIGNSSTTCNASAAGTIRWTGSAFEGCDGASWISLGSTTSNTSVEVYVWGAGGGGVSNGGGSSYGGAGGYSYYIDSFPSNTVLGIVVGAGGQFRGDGCGQGGGYSGVFKGSVAQNNSLVIAGGGGGGSYSQHGAPGGGSTAASGGGGAPGGGGTQSAGGTASSGGAAGSALTGGAGANSGGDTGVYGGGGGCGTNTWPGGGGGGGYYGGGGGGSNGTSTGYGSGGGGSSFLLNTANGVMSTGTTGNTSPPSTGSSYYTDTAGVGGTQGGSGKNGLVVIVAKGTTYTFHYTGYLQQFTVP